MRGRLRRLLNEDAYRETVATKALGGTFAVALLVVVGLGLSPISAGDQYTEFYVLGPDGTASGYPETVTVGETSELRVGVENHEGGRQTYTLVVGTNETTFVTQTIAVDGQSTWEAPVTVAFDSPGRKLLRLELYVGEATGEGPYRSLRLFVEVNPK